MPATGLSDFLRCFDDGCPAVALNKRFEELLLVVLVLALEPFDEADVAQLALLAVVKKLFFLAAAAAEPILVFNVVLCRVDFFFGADESDAVAPPKNDAMVR